MSPRRWLVAVAVGTLAFVVFGSGWTTSAQAGPPIPTLGTTTTVAPPTTEPPTTEPPTTATTRPVPAATRPPATVIEEPTFEQTTSTLEPTTTSSIPLLVEGPPVGPDAVVTTTTTTAPAVVVGAEEGETGRQVALAVSGLLALAVVFAGLTWWYWKRTKPRARVEPAGVR